MTKTPARIDPARELPHPPAGTPNWSENYLFQGYDPNAEVGFYHHLGRQPADPRIWRGAFAACLPGGEVLAFKDYARTERERGPASAALSFHCEEPFRRWTVRYDGVARRTSSDSLRSGILRDGAMALVEMEISFEALVGPWSFGAGIEAEAWASFHYEQPGRITGKLRVDGRTIDLAGTGYRDHSTGPRDVSPMLSHTWVHGEFPSGRGFQAFATHSVPDQRFSSAYLLSEGALHPARIVDAPSWSRADGDPVRFTVRLESDAGSAEIEARTLAQRFYWTILSPWEFVIGADLEARGASELWPCLETMVEYRWGGETGYGLLEVTRPRAPQVRS